MFPRSKRAGFLLPSVRVLRRVIIPIGFCLENIFLLMNSMSVQQLRCHIPCILLFLSTDEACLILHLPSTQLRLSFLQLLVGLYFLSSLNV